MPGLSWVRLLAVQVRLRCPERRVESGGTQVGSFTVVFVCHANMCRSPMAERFAAHMWRGGVGGRGGAGTFPPAGPPPADGENIVGGAAALLPAHRAPHPRLCRPPPAP